MGLRGSCEQKAASQCKVTSARFVSYVLREGVAFCGACGRLFTHWRLPDPLPFFARCQDPGRKTFLASLVVLVMLSPRAYAEPNSLSLSPVAPTRATVKSPLFRAVDGSLSGSVVVAPALDWSSNEESKVGSRPLRRPERAA
jgi:hypothetical protein